MPDASPFWEDPVQVHRFSQREPDQRMLELLTSYVVAADTRVLDLGCAAGRNTVVLAAQGFDFYARDTSHAMVEHTRERVASHVGREEARRRVMLGAMEDLGDFAPESFDLVLALGVYHQATCREQWDKALGATARVLKGDGMLLVANFTPRTDLRGRGIRPHADEAHVYTGFEAGPVFLLEAPELDAEMGRHGLEPVVPSRTVETPTETGRRVTVNAQYRMHRRDCPGIGV